MLSAYGGVGSILETSKGALIVEEFGQMEILLSDASRIFDQDEYHD